MPRFSIRDLLTATAIMATGLTVAMLAVNALRQLRFPPYEPIVFIGYGLFGVGLSIAGAGLFHPLKRRKTGALLGFLVGAAIIVLDLVL